ncbi:MAG TPA: molybdopterin-synthase adenylyltransferase MoeB [Candidatus Polarisedimenticolaceae bacterium]|nr:molybdopterin-synthase adenylyltransferase MoeB [Candidatus Polarisedimenticolaceae bacterium]
MSTVTVRIPTPLRTFTNGASEVRVQASTVGEALGVVGQTHDGILERVLDRDGRVRGFVNIYLGEHNIRDVGGLDARLDDPSPVISIVPAVAGGAGARQRRLAELRAAIAEVSPREAHALQQRGAVLIDVRETDETAQGGPAGATRVTRGFLELKIEELVPDPSTPILTMCASGVRSLFAADGLRQLGYRNVRNVASGFSGWKSAGLPVDVPRTLTPDQRERYGRHLAIPEISEQGQTKLLDAKVLLVGAGGLGSPAAYYLAAAGVGTLGIVDDDVVDRSNLQRQILHQDARVGQPKVDSAGQTLIALNPTVVVERHRTRLTRFNVDEIVPGYDVVVDGSDNFSTRYLVNDACIKHAKPNVHGSVYRFEGQVSVFWPSRANRPGPCYRCLYPEPPPPELAPSCADAGVLGVLPGVIGLLQAVETIKLLLDLGTPLAGRLLQYDALEQRFTMLRVNRDPRCAYCGDGRDFPGYVDYDDTCRAPLAS